MNSNLFLLFYFNLLMFEFKCKKTLVCVRCGDCCHIRQSNLVKISNEEDYKIRKKVYENTGIIYLEPLKNYTISISKEEKERMEKKAKELGVKIKILPKKIVINKSKTKAEIIDYYVDHDVCPFLKGKAFCRIYEDRPTVCRIFPHVMKQDTINPSILVDKNSNFDSVLKKAKELTR